MIPAPTLNSVKTHFQEKENPLRCILFAPAFDQVAIKDFIPRLGYLDSRTRNKIIFYCAGYGGYWRKEDYPDMKEVGNATYKDGVGIPWAFSELAFSDFVDQLEAVTSWTYSGGTELIILNAEANFKNAIIFKVDEMIKDGVINKAYELFEGLIQIAKEDNPTIANFSLVNIGKQSADVLVESIKEMLPGPIKSLTKLWTKGKHYTIEDISK